MSERSGPVKAQHSAQPIDVAAADTILFIEQAVELRNRRLLEVGCGQGHLARLLQQRGASVLAIDSRQEAVDDTLKKGVDAKLIDFFDLKSTSERFDAIVFGRSFHHLQPLSVAVATASMLLKDDGALILEEFAAERMDERTISWVKEHWGKLLSEPGETEHSHHHAEAFHSVSGWQEHHFDKHHVTKFSEMIQELEHHFKNIRASACPYLFRYLLDHLPPTEAGARQLERAREDERRAVDQQLITAIGMRVVASVRRSLSDK